MRLFWLLAALMSAFLLSAGADAQGQRDWRKAVRATPGGAHVVGNPAAKVKLVEYLSYTCPHCGEFVRDSKAPLLDGMVRNGSVSIELRPLTRNGIDLAAGMLVRCTGPAGLLAAQEAVFAQQPAMLAKAQRLQIAQDAPQAQQLKAAADGTGLTALLDKRIPGGAAKCLAATADRDRLIAIAQGASGRIRGTPSFEINGQLVEGHDWASLEPQLRAAGAR
ncbi:DsbA family protein [Sphingomonas baiyangensis]|uniref:Thioredoxin-like fold domain-containing protein n=1 Tax=Sphingomonas baiyangensis TaxID=2572576 RepID=A0A4U1LA28_9SPHN|nr:thioredoxin domain-containing protein [Sphingomonas baiyangensis]TKD53270.1 hypothetical protein FBR43_02805 [Sphingomonas baiyangensis]